MSGTENLLSLNKKQLVDLILSSQDENIKLKRCNYIMNDANKEIESLERRMNISDQYYRRESVEISGINADIDQNKLEDKVSEIL